MGQRDVEEGAKQEAQRQKGRHRKTHRLKNQGRKKWKGKERER